MFYYKSQSCSGLGDITLQANISGTHRVMEVILLNVGVAVVSLAVLLIPSYLIGKISPIKAIQFQ